MRQVKFKHDGRSDERQRDDERSGRKPMPRMFHVRQEMVDQVDSDAHQGQRYDPPDDTPLHLEEDKEFEVMRYGRRHHVAQIPQTEAHDQKQSRDDRCKNRDNSPLHVAAMISRAGCD